MRRALARIVKHGGYASEFVELLGGLAMEKFDFAVVQNRPDQELIEFVGVDRQGNDEFARLTLLQRQEHALRFEYRCAAGMSAVNSLVDQGQVVLQFLLIGNSLGDFSDLIVRGLVRDRFDRDKRFRHRRV